MSQPPKPPKPPKVRNAARRLKLLVAGTTLLVLGLLGTGAFGGFWLHERYGTPPAPVLALDGVTVAEDRALATAVVVPDVLLLSRVDAEDALADAGVDLASVTTKEVPHAGAPGLVVAQDPRRGTRDPGKVTLTLAKATTVPVVVGRSADEVAAQLEQLGAVVVRTASYAPGKPAGQVLSVEPAAGKPLPERVVLRVSGEPEAVYLDALSPVRGGCGSGTVELAGQSFDHALSCDAGSTPSVTAYALGGLVDRFDTGVAGADGSEPVTLRVLLDGKVLAMRTLRPGTVEDLSLPVTGGRELVLEARSATSADWWLADPRLLGTAAAADRLAAGG